MEILLLDLIRSLEFIIASVSVIVIVILIIVLFHLKKKPKQQRLSDESKKDLLIALGGSHNISDLKLEHKRLKIRVNNIKNIDAKGLQSLGIPAFIKTNELTLLIKEQPQEIKEFLNVSRKRG